MPDEKFRSVLETIGPRLNALPSAWAVAGSLGFALQGLDIEIHDVDVQTERVGAYEIGRRLSGYVTRPASFTESGRIRPCFGGLEIDGDKVGIIGVSRRG
jgi:hypothetical protein